MGIKFHWFRYVNYVALTQCCFGTNLVFTAGSVRYTRSDQAASLQLSDNHFYWIYSNSVYRLYYFLSTLNPQQLVTTTLTLEASLVTNGMDNLLNYHMYSTYGFVWDPHHISLLLLISLLHIPVHSPQRVQWPPSLTQLNRLVSPRQNQHRLQQKSSSSYWKVVN